MELSSTFFSSSHFLYIVHQLILLGLLDFQSNYFSPPPASFKTCHPQMDHYSSLITGLPASTLIPPLYQRCNPMDCSPPGSSVHGILHARILESVAMPFSRGILQGNPPNPGIEHTSLTSPALAGRFFTTSTTWEAWELQLAFSYRNTVIQMGGLTQERLRLRGRL